MGVKVKECEGGREGECEGVRVGERESVRVEERGKMTWLKHYHGLDIADALKGIVQSSVSHLHKHLLDGTIVVVRVNKVSRTKLLGCACVCVCMTR